VAGGAVIRIVVADDHTLVRAGLRSLLEDLPDVQVVAECGDGREALAAVDALRPDIALLDISMPGLNGLDAAARIASASPGTRVVIVSMHSNERYVAQALAAGVAGYVLKNAAVEELPILLRSVMRGETYLSPAISKQVVEALRARLTGGAAPPPDPLTPRQREILQLLAEGKNTKEVAHLLGLSAKTVEAHRAQIMDRLDIHDVPGLVRYAIRTGLVASDE
jgi:DNA-binding NarL/FixJ family response regulator